MSHTVRRLAPVGLAAVALVTLAACGGGSTPNAASDPGTQTQQYGGGTQARQLPGAFGTIAAISGKTLQVQNQMSGQVAVTYTGATAISAEVKTSLAGVHVGSCVVVTTDSSGSGSSTDSGPVTASAVRVSAGTDGSCGMRGRPGGVGDGPSDRPSGAPSGRPSEMPGGAPSGMPSGGPGNGAGRSGFGTVGEVRSVTKDGFTVAAFRPTQGSASPSTTTVSVRVTGSTTYTTTQKATATALKVGRCVQASGKTDDTGAVTATSMSVSDPVDGQCGGGFMMRSSQ